MGTDVRDGRIVVEAWVVGEEEDTLAEGDIQHLLLQTIADNVEGTSPISTFQLRELDGGIEEHVLSGVGAGTRIDSDVARVLRSVLTTVLGVLDTLTENTTSDNS